MLGFLPGFPYLGTVDERIAVPRLSTPRLRVAAGSVGIAGTQTGIYPMESPGGWRIIGRTPVVLFDPMFGRSQGAQPPFQVLRRHATHAPLTPELLALGRRAARRVVVVKAARYSDALKGLGLVPEPHSRFTQVVYARASPHP